MSSVENWNTLHYIALSLLIVCYPISKLMHRLFHIALRLNKAEVYGIYMKPQDAKVRHFVLMAIICAISLFLAGESVNLHHEHQMEDDESKDESIHHQANF